MAWIHRLSDLRRWLDIAKDRSPELDDAFEVRWGDVADGDGLVMGLPDGELILTDGAQVWFRLKNCGVLPHLYLSVFRVRGDRTVEHLTAHSAGGIVSGVERPAQLGRDEPRQVLTWAPPLEGIESMSEALVAVVTARPLPLHVLARLRSAGGPARAMCVVRYQLRAAPGQ